MSTRSQWEAVIGRIWQLSSAGGRANRRLAESQAKTSEMLTLAQVNKLTLESEAVLVEKIAAAIKAKDLFMAKGLAAILAKQPGNQTYKTLLQNIMNSP
jgi:hypothetical protein